MVDESCNEGGNGKVIETGKEEGYDFTLYLTMEGEGFNGDLAEGGVNAGRWVVD